MDRVLLDETIETDYGQFDLVWTDGGGFDGDSDRFFAGQTNGLVGAASSGGMYMNLARRSGGSDVRIVLHEAEPDIDADWEDVVEVSILVPEGRDVVWRSWAGERSGPLEIAPGTYRVRVSACGRDAGAVGELADDVVDRYLVDLWPSPAEPDHVVRAESGSARYWHEAWGSQR